MEEKETLKSPDAFPFPFEPYSIQVDFMKRLYDAIENGKIGIFESPTGTGKSLSLICGSLTWLRDHEKREERRIQELLASQKKSTANIAGDVDWIEEFATKQTIKLQSIDAKTEAEKRKKYHNKLKVIRNQTEVVNIKPKRRVYKRKRDESTDETLALLEMAKKEIEGHFNPQVDTDEDLQELIPVDYESGDEEKEKEDDEDCHMTRIYFCSRTHSQLTQFVHELQKSPFGKPLIDDSTDEPFQVAMVTLGSRNSLCVNESVRKLKSLHLINERCLEMQKNANKKSQSTEADAPKKKKKQEKARSTCCYYSNHEGGAKLTSQVIAKVTEIEELVKEGRNIEACPYYASRRAVPFSQLVVLPYQTLLHRPTREASGINLKDAVIIVDEAHNLIDAMNSMHSAKITVDQVTQAHNQLSQYHKKFIKRLKAKNLFYVKQILFVLQHLRDSITTKSENPKPKERLLTVNEFLFESSLDNVNFFKLLRYCQRSQIAKKLSGFVEKYEGAAVENKSSLTSFLSNVNKSTAVQPRAPGPENITMRSPLMHIESFFASMTSSSVTGRVALTTTDAERSLKFLLLNPSEHFKDVLDDCRSLIVAGGTMQPSSCLINQLLAHAESSRHVSRVVEFSCDHVIDGATQLLPIALSSGPCGEVFEFNYEKRGNPKMIDEVGRTLLNVSNLIPGGMVCFFTSYEYEALVYKRWQQTGLADKIGAKKNIFREPKKSDQVEQVLGEYSKCIRRNLNSGGKLNGAILLCVVGGKMSEGINFSDWLGRCVVMVGLPYPNLHSPELKQKIEFLDRNMPNDKDGRTAGQAHYEDLCLKAVNQSIGRAIRHRNDYACILLLDKRYHKPQVHTKLPQWISKHLQFLEQFGKSCLSIRKFFKEKETPPS